MAKIEEIVNSEKEVSPMTPIDTSAKEESFLAKYKTLTYTGMCSRIHDPVTGRDWFPGESQLATDDEVTRLCKIEYNQWNVQENK